MATETSALERLRVDQVGSFLRPPELKDAFDRFQGGRIGEEELGAVQDGAIRGLVEREERHGLPVITDGEYRRRLFFDNFADVAGLEQWRANWGGLMSKLGDEEGTSAARGADPLLESRKPVTEKLRLIRNRPLEEYEFVQGLTDRTAKASMTSLDRLSQDFSSAGAHDVYADVDAFMVDVVAVQRQMVGEIVAAGCRYVQIDAPNYTGYVDQKSLAAIRARGEDPIESLERGIRADNAVVEAHPKAIFGIHLCRGNRQSHWHREGSYEAVAERLFGGLAHQRLLLEYDDERAGDFKPLRFVPKGKVAVLGLITTKTGELESADEVKRRIEEAASYLPIEQLALSPQCGFASVIEGNLISEDEQWRKIELVLEVAQDVWGASAAEPAGA